MQSWEPGSSRFPHGFRVPRTLPHSTLPTINLELDWIQTGNPCEMPVLQKGKLACCATVPTPLEISVFKCLSYVSELGKFSAITLSRILWHSFLSFIQKLPRLKCWIIWWYHKHLESCFCYFKFFFCLNFVYLVYFKRFLKKLFNVKRDFKILLFFWFFVTVFLYTFL